jgi:hypothetical protein
MLELITLYTRHMLAIVCVSTITLIATLIVIKIYKKIKEKIVINRIHKIFHNDEER